jgi:hypothetical protein
MHKLLVPIDGSNHALDHAIALAKGRGGYELDLLNVHPDPIVYGETQVYVTIERLLEEQRRHSRALLAPAAEKAKAGGAFTGSRSRAATRPLPRPVNLGNPNELTVSEPARKVQRLTGCRSGIVQKSLPGDDPKRRRPNREAARELQEWVPRVPLASGLDKTIEWFAADLLSAGPSDRRGERSNGRLARRPGPSPARAA